jgi:hypothetical protein
MATKSHRTESDTLVRVARTTGYTLGTIAAKVNRAPKVARRTRKRIKSRVKGRAKAVLAAKGRSKRRK